MSSNKGVNSGPKDILQYFGQRHDLRALYWVDKSELTKSIWIVDANIFSDGTIYEKCEIIVKNGNFIVSNDVIAEVLDGPNPEKDSDWYRGRKLAKYIIKNFSDKIYKKKHHQLIKELRSIKDLVSKNITARLFLNAFEEIYEAFQDKKALDRMMKTITEKGAMYAGANFDKRAHGKIQESKYEEVKKFIVDNLKSTVIAIFIWLRRNIKKEMNLCKQLLEKKFFKPLETDIEIASIYLAHDRTKHRLASNDKDVVELILCHDYRALP